ncbi:hypothetical protein [Bacillus phage PK2]|nr:hypothetical protein [Bacillus phage PK2]
MRFCLRGGARANGVRGATTAQKRGGIYMKVESINFQNFVRDDWRKVSPKPAFSFIPFPSFSTMFLNEPVLIIAGIGVGVIGLTLYEKYLVSKGREYDAEVISMIVGIGLPTGAVIGAIYVLSKAGSVFLW